jgi:ADP-ribose pyrophosphatase
MSPINRMISPIQKLQTIIRTIPMMTWMPPSEIPEEGTTPGPAGPTAGGDSHRRYPARMELLGSKIAYEGFGIDVAVRRYRREDGTEVERQVVEHPGSVAILAHDDEFVYLVSQPREAVEEDALLEIPAGTLDHEGETELECGRRELAEEAYLAATDWTELTKIYPSPGYISEVVTIFIATGLSPASGERDEDEAIDIVRLPLAELDETLPRIRDASTLIALMALRDRLAGGAD